MTMLCLRAFFVHCTAPGRGENRAYCYLCRSEILSLSTCLRLAHIFPNHLYHTLALSSVSTSCSFSHMQPLLAFIVNDSCATVSGLCSADVSILSETQHTRAHTNSLCITYEDKFALLWYDIFEAFRAAFAKPLIWSSSGTAAVIRLIHNRMCSALSEHSTLDASLEQHSSCTSY